MIPFSIVKPHKTIYNFIQLKKQEKIPQNMPIQTISIKQPHPNIKIVQAHVVPRDKYYSMDYHVVKRTKSFQVQVQGQERMPIARKLDFSQRSISPSRLPIFNKHQNKSMRGTTKVQNQEINPENSIAKSTYSKTNVKQLKVSQQQNIQKKDEEKSNKYSQISQNKSLVESLNIKETQRLTKIKHVPIFRKQPEFQVKNINRHTEEQNSKINHDQHIKSNEQVQKSMMMSVDKSKIDNDKIDSKTKLNNNSVMTPKQFEIGQNKEAFVQKHSQTFNSQQLNQQVEYRLHQPRSARIIQTTKKKPLIFSSYNKLLHSKIEDIDQEKINMKNVSYQKINKKLDFCHGLNQINIQPCNINVKEKEKNHQNMHGSRQLQHSELFQSAQKSLLLDKDSKISQVKSLYQNLPSPIQQSQTKSSPQKQINPIPQNNTNINNQSKKQQQQMKCLNNQQWSFKKIKGIRKNTDIKQRYKLQQNSQNNDKLIHLKPKHSKKMTQNNNLQENASISSSNTSIQVLVIKNINPIQI